MLLLKKLLMNMLFLFFRDIDFMSTAFLSSQNNNFFYGNAEMLQNLQPNEKTNMQINTNKNTISEKAAEPHMVLLNKILMKMLFKFFTRY